MNTLLMFILISLDRTPEFYKPRSSGLWWCNPEDGGSKVLRSSGILLQHYTVSQPRRPQLEG